MNTLAAYLNSFADQSYTHPYVSYLLVALILCSQGTKAGILKIIEKEKKMEQIMLVSFIDVFSQNTTLRY